MLCTDNVLCWKLQLSSFWPSYFFNPRRDVAEHWRQSLTIWLLVSSHSVVELLTKLSANFDEMWVGRPKKEVISFWWQLEFCCGFWISISRVLCHLEINWHFVVPKHSTTQMLLAVRSNIWSRVPDHSGSRSTNFLDEFSDIIGKVSEAQGRIIR